MRSVENFAMEEAACAVHPRVKDNYTVTCNLHDEAKGSTWMLSLHHFALSA